MEGKWIGPWRKLDDFTVVDANGDVVADTHLEKDTDLIAQAPAMAKALEKLVEEYRSIWMSEGGGADACEHILAPYRALLTAIKGE